MAASATRRPPLENAATLQQLGHTRLAAVRRQHRRKGAVPSGSAVNDIVSGAPSPSWLRE